MRNKLLAVALAATMAATSLAGCGSSAPATTETPAASGAETTTTILLF